MNKCIFVDVDETLVNFKSMASFLFFYLTDQGFSEYKKNKIISSLVCLAKEGRRNEANHNYFKLFRGVKLSYLEKIGEMWFSSLDKSTVFIDEVLNHIEPKRKDARLVLVSGSFNACLNPIANYVKASDIICTQLEIENGSLSGKVFLQLLGDQKGISIKKYARDNKVDLNLSYAYADDISDISMLDLVGNPNAIIHKSNTLLREEASKKNYNTIFVK